MATTNIITLEGDWLVSADTNYQGYRANVETGETIPTGKRVIRKWAALKDIFPDLVRGKTFLDIGSAQGFFLWKALECGAEWAGGIEKRESYYQAFVDALLALPGNSTPEDIWAGNLGIKNVSFPDQMPASVHTDVVMCLSLVHHLFPLYSLTGILSHLSFVTNETLLVEFPGRADKMVQRKKWLDDHPEYNREAFEEIAKAEFAKVEFVNVGHHDTRWIYRMDK